MKAKTLIATTLVLGLILVPASLILAQGGPGGPHGGRGHHGHLGPRMAQALELTEEQREQIRELRENLGEPSTGAREQMEQIRGELHELWMAPEPSKQAILAKMAEMEELHQQMREKMVDFRLAFLEILTPEQREKMQEMRENRPERGERGKGKGRQGRGGWSGQDTGSETFGEW